MTFESRPRSTGRDVRSDLAALLVRLRDEVGFEFDLRFDVPAARQASMPEHVRSLLHDITREAILNAARHSEATTVDVALTEVDGGVLVLVSDDGRGMLPKDLRAGAGIGWMRDRAEAAGGWCRIWSLPAAGTTVKFWLPWRGEPLPEPTPARSTEARTG